MFAVSQARAVRGGPGMRNTPAGSNSLCTASDESSVSVLPSARVTVTATPDVVAAARALSVVMPFALLFVDCVTLPKRGRESAARRALSNVFPESAVRTLLRSASVGAGVGSAGAGASVSGAGCSGCGWACASGFGVPPPPPHAARANGMARQSAATRAARCRPGPCILLLRADCYGAGGMPGRCTPHAGSMRSHLFAGPGSYPVPDRGLSYSAGDPTNAGSRIWCARVILDGATASVNGGKPQRRRWSPCGGKLIGFR